MKKGTKLTALATGITVLGVGVGVMFSRPVQETLTYQELVTLNSIRTQYIEEHGANFQGIESLSEAIDIVDAGVLVEAQRAGATFLEYVCDNETKKCTHRNTTYEQESYEDRVFELIDKANPKVIPDELRESRKRR